MQYFISEAKWDEERLNKLNGSFSRSFSQQPKTVGEQLEMFRRINSITAAYWIKDTKTLSDLKNCFVKLLNKI